MFLCRLILYLYVYGFSSHHLWEIEELDNPALSANFHMCSNEGIRVREQVETLRTQFNDRMGKIILVATVTSYYSTFIPWCFAQVGSWIHDILRTINSWWLSNSLLICLTVLRLLRFMVGLSAFGIQLAHNFLLALESILLSWFLR